MCDAALQLDRTDVAYRDFLACRETLGHHDVRSGNDCTPLVAAVCDHCHDCVLPIVVTAAHQECPPSSTCKDVHANACK